MVSPEMLTASYTVIIGVSVYVFSRIISKFIIEPIYEQRRVIGEIADALYFYARIYANPGSLSLQQLNQISDELRKLSTLLRAKTHLIPFYGFFEKICVVPKLSNIREASSELIGLSNSLGKPPLRMTATAIAVKNVKRADNIKKLLKLKIE